MMYPDDNDTLFSNNQFDAQPNDNNKSNENEESNERSSKLSSRKKLNMKDAAVFVGGGVAGASVSMATNAFAGQTNEPSESSDSEESNEETDESAEQQTAGESSEQMEQEPAPIPEPTPATKPQPTPHPQHEPQPTPQHEPQPEPDPNVTPVANGSAEPTIYQENDVKIETIRTYVTDEGNILHTASGTVNGHDAIFVDDGHGNVMEYAVDNNDNHLVDDDEIVRTDGQGMTMGNLAEHMVETEVKVEPTPSSSTSSEVQVIAVEDNIDMEGHPVDVAVVMVEGTAGVLVDVTQNGEVDILAVDVNHDGYLNQDETRVVSDAHMPMPIANDIYGNNENNSTVDNNELPDYSNDNDITIYDI